MSSHATSRPRRTVGRPVRLAVAGGAALLLMMGAGGTFAQWYDATPVAGGQISAGALSLAPADEGAWFDISPDKTARGITTSSFAMVPGDVLEYRADLVPTLDGDNLEATLRADVRTPEGALAEFVTVTATVDGDAEAVLTEADSGQTVPVRVRVELPFSTGGAPGSGNGTDAQGTVLDLDSLSVQLVQNDRG